MSATDEVRAELTKRGVKWIDIPLVSMSRTCWKASDKQDGYCYYEEDEYGTELTISRATPEQAIEVTLRRGTCVPILNSERDRRPYLSLWFVCSECGCRLTENRLGKVWQKFCPQCGRRVKKVYEC